ncbi:anthranilate phosphoribosyltransferase [Saccharomonospora xinjiangensis]|uniref:anthranilate phosphoribosyltransferase n=1 Tax=Saccharomonospora xinjiangensis TaxID=75294 RepID=UPI00106F4B18|nr:anthranilate phosphoribosyltransferase [Saccharomonospora xinjiangensis]QBQ59533.1 Anthranilate phosphoribosyltransferase [Saccharomonospora xinjiangensis]
MPEHTWPTVLNQLIERIDLSEDATAWAMNQVMAGEATPAQIAGFAVALRAKGETATEISGMAQAMLAHAKRVDLPMRTVDIVGTGGDRKGSVNISTMTSLVVAAAGTPVVKHGNRAASSKSGAADVLEALGVTIDSDPDDVRRCVEEIGIGFCFAPVFHPAYRHTGPPRRELGVSTAFNLLGPLTNPAQPSSGLIGCAYLDKAPVLAEVYARRGHSVLLVRGDDGFDEITTTTTSTAWVVSGGEVRTTSIDPEALGIPLSGPDALRGGDATANAEVVRELVGGKTGPVRDAVLLNAAGALAAYAGFSEDLTADLRAGLELATRAIDSGAAADLLNRWIKRR